MKKEKKEILERMKLFVQQLKWEELDDGNAHLSYKIGCDSDDITVNAIDPEIMTVSRNDMIELTEYYISIFTDVFTIDAISIISDGDLCNVVYSVDATIHLAE